MVDMPQTQRAFDELHSDISPKRVDLYTPVALSRR